MTPVAMCTGDHRMTERLTESLVHIIDVHKYSSEYVCGCVLRFGLSYELRDVNTRERHSRLSYG